MKYALFFTILLHVFPFISLFTTWKNPDNIAEERIVRFQVIASVVYFFVYPLIQMSTWPNFQFSPVILVNILGQWHDDGLWGAFHIVVPACITAFIIFFRRKIKNS